MTLVKADPLQYLLDRQAIADVLAGVARYLDEYDLDKVGEFFVSDCMMDQGPKRGGPIHGHRAVIDGMKTRQAKFRRTNHQLGQSIVTIDGDAADALTYVHAWHETWEGERQAVRLRYRDKFARLENGQWKISSRTSEAMGVDGFEESMWNWVERLSPASGL